MKKTKKITIIILILIAVIFIAIFLIRLFSGEDSWICKDAHWVKHGHPSSEMPVETCR